jgi:hypothetical protein
MPKEKVARRKEDKRAAILKKFFESRQCIKTWSILPDEGTQGVIIKDIIVKFEPKYNSNGKLHAMIAKEYMNDQLLFASVFNRDGSASCFSTLNFDVLTGIWYSIKDSEHANSYAIRSILKGYTTTQGKSVTTLCEIIKSSTGLIYANSYKETKDDPVIVTTACLTPVDEPM